MSISMAIFTYINLWWIAMILVLPFFTRKDEAVDPLSYAAAPKSMPWKRVILTASALAAVFTITLALLIKIEMIPLRTLTSS
ncbi:MAG: DUF1467 family protein [Rickettsiales bacterium]|nr:DUF1467 family protein [Rickettsiales bacterium]